MTRGLRIILTMTFAGLIMAGCASGPTFSKISSALPGLSNDMGRIYFYRESSPVGAAVQPSIMLNGAKVGDSVPGGVFFKDVKPGNYEVATSTEVERKLTFTVAAGQTRFVETSIGFGFAVGRVHPTLVDPKVGEKAIQDLSFTGQHKLLTSGWKPTAMPSCSAIPTTSPSRNSVSGGRSRERGDASCSAIPSGVAFVAL